MPPTASNVVLVMADQHRTDALGVCGRWPVHTPWLDGLARRGTRFTSAVCPSPLCVPARASTATGRFVHTIGTWDNASPYDGSQAPSWGHRLTAAGRGVATIGKLHFRDAAPTSGFVEQHLPMHVVDGVGDPYGLLRGSMPPMVSAREDVLAAGPGESDYIAYDRAIADRAVAWLGSEGASTPEPWALWVSFVSPHFPLLSPERHWDRYAHADLPLPATRRPGRWSTHPEVDTSRRLQAHDEPYSDEQVRRATAAYLGLVSFVDEQVGRVLQALERSGLSDRTRVIYTSDHGEMLGEHGIWGKSVMLEGALGVPMIMAGPQIPSEAVRTDPVSLVDLFPTIVESTGLSLDEDIGLPGRSLFAPAAPDRSVFSEYHGECSSMGAFSMRRGTKKLIAYPDAPTQRFDLAADPAETDDQTSRRAWHSDFDDLERALRSSVDIERVDARARADQQALLERFGGAQAVIARGETVPFTPVPVEFLRDPP